MTPQITAAVTERQGSIVLLQLPRLHPCININRQPGANAEALREIRSTCGQYPVFLQPERSEVSISMQCNAKHNTGERYIAVALFKRKLTPSCRRLCSCHRSRCFYLVQCCVACRPLM